MLNKNSRSSKTYVVRCDNKNNIVLSKRKAILEARKLSKERACSVIETYITENDKTICKNEFEIYLLGNYLNRETDRSSFPLIWN